MAAAPACQDRQRPAGRGGGGLGRRIARVLYNWIGAEIDQFGLLMRGGVDDRDLSGTVPARAPHPKARPLQRDGERQEDEHGETRPLRAETGGGGENRDLCRQHQEAREDETMGEKPDGGDEEGDPREMIAHEERALAAMPAPAKDDEAPHASIPLVEGTRSAWRGSSDTASPRTRATALKQVSAI